MKRGRILLIYIIIIVSGICPYSAFAAYTVPQDADRVISTDTISVRNTSGTRQPKHEKPRYSVKKTTVESYDDLDPVTPADLETPENVKSVVEYDTKTGCYVIRTKVSGMEITTPFMLTPKEYSDYSLRK